MRRGGKLPGITDNQASHKDVTDQCQAELEHRALEVRFAHAFESAPFGMSLVSALPELLGRYVKANQAYCEMVGYSQEELVTMAVSSVVHPDDAEHYAGVVHDLSAGCATAVECELRMLRRDGSAIWVRQRRSLVRDDAGRPFYVFSHSEDVSQRKAEQAALADATQRLHHCFENAPIAMVLLSVDPANPGRYLEVNHAACRMTGYSREQLLGLRSQELTHPDDDLAEEARALQRLLVGDVESYERATAPPSGSRHPHRPAQSQGIRARAQTTPRRSSALPPAQRLAHDRPGPFQVRQRHTGPCRGGRAAPQGQQRAGEALSVQRYPGAARRR